MPHDPVPVGIPKFESIEKMYESATEQIEALLDDGAQNQQQQTQQQKSDNTAPNPWRLYARLITGLSNVSSVLFYHMNAQFTEGKDAPLHTLPINWCGFYLLDRPDRLALSAFQGKVACQHIKLGKGMCGKSVLTNTDLAIEDVQADPGHIACDAASQSEAVICIRDPATGKAVGCLDIDSAVKGRFTAAQDVAPLRKICDVIAKHLGDELRGLFNGISATMLPTPAPMTAVGAATAPGLMQTSIAAVKIMPGGGLTPLTTGALGKMPPPPASGSTVTTRPAKIVTSGDSKRTPAEEEGKIVKHQNWELRHRTVHEMLNSQKLEVLEKSLDVKLLPEIIFGLNEIHFVMEQAAAGRPLKFRVCAQTSLQNVVKYSTSEQFKSKEKDSLFPVESASWEKQRTEMKTFDPNVDWAFRNNYRGVWSDAEGKEVELKEVASIDDKQNPCEPDDVIDYDMLRNTSLPILFFSAIDLWEDDLHDSGLSQMSSKARVMGPCFFVLVRHVLRVDGVRMQVRDTRHFHKFGSKKICIEETCKGVDIKKYLAAEKDNGLSSEEFHRTLMNTPVEQLTMLQEEWKKNYVIQL